MISPKLALLVKAPEKGLGKWKQKAHASGSSWSPWRCLLGREGGSVWHFSTRTAEGRQDVWPSGTWELRGDANLAWWLHPASTNTSEQSRSMKHALVLGVGNLPSPGRRESAWRLFWVLLCSPSSVSEGPAAPDGSQELHRGEWCLQRGGGAASGAREWCSPGRVPALPGKPDRGLGRFPWCKYTLHSLRYTHAAPLDVELGETHNARQTWPRARLWSSHWGAPVPLPPTLSPPQILEGT